MPDDLDYEWLGWLVTHPQDWTDEDAATARWLVANQRSSIESMHPKDARRRQSAQRVVDDLEAAINVYRETKA